MGDEIEEHQSHRFRRQPLGQEQSWGQPLNEDLVDVRKAAERVGATCRSKPMTKHVSIHISNGLDSRAASATLLEYELLPR
jgi:hypothetical protein